MNGVIIINKPAEWTSHDVVAKTRGLLKERQIGHLGTLDPLATGVLPLAVGAATRLIEFTSYPKEYVTTCLLGKTTDSCDVTGNILGEKPANGLSEETVRAEVLKLGDIMEQVPPMVSALKKDGKKLYELARQGVEVERKARPIRMEAVEILNINIPRVTFRVACSAGTYVRVLCQTLGEQLGVGGCMETLERTWVGSFSLAESLTLAEVKKGVEAGNLSGMLLPASRLVSHLPQVQLKGKVLENLCQGRAMDTAGGTPLGLYRVINEQGRLSAVAEASPEGLLKPKKVFGMEGIQ
ncbi:MAG TPA: tRNA pseudouridine(55) synthase TruB [bacterium]|nr:tRNA pseudouridine(55) synthase TruB [bacterium]